MGTVDKGIEGKRVPVSRMIERLGVKKYDVPAPLKEELIAVDKVTIPLRMHIGAPAVPVVAKGDKVNAGDLIGEIKEGALGARVHASITGTVTAVSDNAIEIQA